MGLNLPIDEHEISAMGNELILNHLSLPFACQQDADEGMNTFLEVWIRVKKDYGLAVLRLDGTLDQSMMNVELSLGRHIRDYCNTKRSTDPVRFFKRSLDKKPLAELRTDEMENFAVGLRIGDKNEPEQDVFKVAYVCNMFVFSFASKPIWRESYLNVWVLDLNLNPEDVMNKQLLQISNTSTITAHQALLEQIEKQSLSQIKQAKDIWCNRGTSFPALDFINDLQGALDNWSGIPPLKQLIKALKILNQVASDWQNKVIGHYQDQLLRNKGLDVSGESQTVHNDPSLRKAREFRVNGTSVFVEKHVKFSRGYRLYFYPDSSNKTIYVCYLGPHLPTANH